MPGFASPKKKSPAATGATRLGVEPSAPWAFLSPAEYFPWKPPSAAMRQSPAERAPVQAKPRAEGQEGAGASAAEQEREPSSEEVHRAAAAGVSGAPEPYPHRKEIEASFGRGLGGARAFIGGPAAAASDAIGAAAYARGTSVAFRGPPDLRTAAHEAAHLVQQRSGVTLEGGVGRAGDRYERQADAAADQVVAGRPAGHLLPLSGGGSPPAVQRQAVAAPAKETIDFKKEYDSLKFKNAIRSEAAYREMRDAILAKFGTLEQANTYYEGVKPHSFMGKSVSVHEATLGVRLNAAEKLLKQKKNDDDTTWYDAVIGGVRGVGGFVIRRNTNNKTKLSDHSFGWAIDVNDSKNPNLPDFPAAAVLGLTGQSLFSGATNKAIRKGGTAEEVEPLAEQVREASSLFQKAFVDESSLKNAMLTYVRTKLGLTVADIDLEVVKAAKEGGNETQKTSFQAIVDLLLGGIGAGPDALKTAQVEQQAEADETLFEKDPKAFAKEMARRKAAAAPPKSGKGGKPAPAPAPAPEKTDAEKAAELDKSKRDVALKGARFLVELWRIFQSSFSDAKRTKRKDPAAHGSAGTIAAHGFMDIDPRLVAALVGSDGGNLVWLGAAEGTKDFMHFELHDSQRPSLTGAAAPAPATTTTTPAAPAAPTPAPAAPAAPAAAATEAPAAAATEAPSMSPGTIVGAAIGAVAGAAIGVGAAAGAIAGAAAAAAIAGPSGATAEEILAAGIAAPPEGTGG